MLELALPLGASVTPLKLKLGQLGEAEVSDEWYLQACRILRGGDGGEHGLLLYKLSRGVGRRGGPLVTLDIGTARGFSALSIARAILDEGTSGHVYSVDVVDHDEPREWHIAKQLDDELEGAPPMSRSQIWQRWFAEESAVVSLIASRSLEVLKTWPHGPIDLAFIDGSHAYEDVSGELELLDPLMAEHCAIVLDDYHLGVVAARVRSRPLNLLTWGIGRTLGAMWGGAPSLAPRLGEGNEFVVLKQRFAGIRKAVSEFLAEREGGWFLEIVTMPSRGEYQSDDYALAVLTRSAAPAPR